METDRLFAAGFQAYGPSHLTVLAVFVTGVVAIIALGPRLREAAYGRRFDRVFAVAILAVTVPLQVLQFLPDEWDLQTSLPFQLCDLAWVFAVHALWTRHRLSVTVTYLWGITLTTQGMFTPDLGSEFPEIRFLMFWAMHLLIVWAAVYLVLGLRILPGWQSYRQTLAITAAWAAAAIGFNLLADTNYGYLNRKPDSASLLDLLGPWPLYVVFEIAVIAAVWALLTWPWCRMRDPDDDLQ